MKNPDKLVEIDQLKLLLWDERERGGRVVLANGCFDLLHVGHVRHLQRARTLGDILVVAVNDDKSSRQLKGEYPIFHTCERAGMLCALECVSYVVIFDGDMCELVSTLQPELHVKGGDFKDKKIPEATVVREYGGATMILPDESHWHTSKIKDTIRQRGDRSQSS